MDGGDGPFGLQREVGLRMSRGEKITLWLSVVAAVVVILGLLPQFPWLTIERAMVIKALLFTGMMYGLAFAWDYWDRRVKRKKRSSGPSIRIDGRLLGDENRSGTGWYWRWIGWTALILILLGTGYTVSVVWFGIERTPWVQARIDELRDVEPGPDSVPAVWVDALLAVEDPSFYQHNGIDLRTPGAGITTITQGLVKIHYFERFRPGLAKYKQTVLAWVLNREVSKEDQLLLFWHTARLGRSDGQPVRGFPRAAQAYFQTPVHDLDPEQFLALVTMVIGPVRYHVIENPEVHAARLARIQRLLAGECQARGLTDVEYVDCADGGGG